jgi:protease II
VPEVPGLKDELTRYTDRTITSPPSFYKGREFFTRKVKGDAQAKLYTRIDGKEVLLFDPMKIDPSGKSALSGRAYSRDASILAVGLQRAGDELPTQFFINSKTGEQVYAPLAGMGRVVDQGQCRCLRAAAPRSRSANSCRSTHSAWTCANRSSGSRWYTSSPTPSGGAVSLTTVFPLHRVQYR